MHHTIPITLCTTNQAGLQAVESRLNALDLPISFQLTTTTPAQLNLSAQRAFIHPQDETLDNNDQLDRVVLPSNANDLALWIYFSKSNKLWRRLRTLWIYPIQLVSAGCGRAEMISVAGREALQNCDICLHDALIDNALLNHLSPTAQAIYVGKRHGKHAMQQQDITKRLTDAAREGLKVVRLKGGDAGIFGRLAEEIAGINELELPFRVIPGVSSLSTATSSSGLLLTRRGISNGFYAYSAATAYNYEAHNHTQVIFMGSSRIEEVCERALNEGWPPTTPLCLILAAGFNNEELRFGTLQTPPQTSHDGRPGLILMGESVAEHYRHQEHGALRGQKVWITGSETMQDRAAALIRRYGGTPICQPLIQLVPNPISLPELHTYDWIILSSPHTVQQLSEQVKDLRTIPKIMAIGQATIDALKAKHLPPDARPHPNPPNQGVLQRLIELAKPHSRILRLRSNAAGTELTDLLRSHFQHVDDISLHHSKPIHRKAPPACTAIVVASDSAAKELIKQCGREWANRRTCVAVGERDAKALKQRGIESIIAPTNEASIAAAIRTLAHHTIGKQLTHL